MKFIWDINKAKENIRNHAVSFDEAVEIFDDLNSIESFDSLHSADELRFRRLGLSSKRLLFLIYTIREVIDNDEVIRIISARKANNKEIIFYNESNKNG
jgi:uncharacterized protein